MHVLDVQITAQREVKIQGKVRAPARDSGLLFAVVRELDLYDTISFHPYPLRGDANRIDVEIRYVLDPRVRREDSQFMGHVLDKVVADLFLEPGYLYVGLARRIDHDEPEVVALLAGLLAKPTDLFRETLQIRTRFDLEGQLLPASFP